MKNYPNECSLLYRKRADIEEFVNDNAAWEGIYELFLSVRDTDGRHNIPAAEMLNEVCRQCARAVTDRYPENNLWEAYDYLDNPGFRYTMNTSICLSLVYAVLELTSLPPKQKDFHLNSLKSILLDNDACRPYYRSALRYVHNQWIDEGRPLIIRIFRWFMSKPLLPFCEKDFLSVAEQTTDGEKQKDNVAAGLKELRRQYDDCRKELESEKNRNRMLQDEIEACRAQERTNGRLQEEVKRLDTELAAEKRQHAEVQQKTEQLQQELELLTDKLKRTEKDGERLPLTAFLDYVENYFTPQQNDRAKVMKEVLGDLYSQQCMTDEEKKRLRKLGTKSVPVSTMTVNGPLNDIHDNGHVRAGM